MEKRTEKPVIQHPGNDILLGWSPDGEYILFRSDRSGTQDVWIQQIGSDGSFIGLPRLVKNNIGDISPGGFNQKGSYYFYNIIYREGSDEFYIVDFNIKNGKLVGNSKSMGNNAWPEYSKDGQFLAWVDEDKNIVIQNLQNDEMKKIPTDLEGIARLRWTADNGTIYFAAGGIKNKKPPEGIYKLDLDSEKITPYLLRKDDSYYYIGYEFSPDDKTVYLRKNDNTPNQSVHMDNKYLIRRDIETGEEKILYSNPQMYWLTGIDLSLDGQRIAFCLHDPEKNVARIMEIPSVGGEPEEILLQEESKAIHRLIYTLDGENILFMKKGDPRVWKVSVEGGDAQLLWEPSVPITRFRLYPNGKMTFQRDPLPEKELWVMENFLP